MTKEMLAVMAKYDALQQSMGNPEIISDSQRLQELMRESARLAPIVGELKKLEAAELAISDARNMEHDPDAEMRNLAALEIRDREKEIQVLEQHISILLLPHDEDDDRNVIMEIRGGAGGEEAALFCSVLYRMYSMFAEKNSFHLELMSANETELGGFKEVTFSISGAGAYAKLKYESGVHRVQRVPETESQGRIHTSTVTVAVLPEVKEVEVDINPADIKMETYRSSGAGGQHINKTDSAVRLIHIPTGIVAECQEERSQFKNRDKAMIRLRAELYDRKRRAQEEERSSARRSQVGTGDRSERIRTYNYPQSRVTDHRIGLTLYILPTFLDGDMNPVLDALAQSDATAKLSAKDHA